MSVLLFLWTVTAEPTVVVVREKARISGWAVAAVAAAVAAVVAVAAGHRLC